MDAPNEEGVSALHLACETRHADGVRPLLAQGASPDIFSINEQIPVCRTKSEKNVRLLKEAGADLRK